MWTSLSRDDLHRAQDEMKQRQLDMEARHIEEPSTLQAKHASERNSLEAKLTHLNEIDHLIDTFVGEYLQTMPADGPPEPIENELAETEPTPKPEPVEVEVIATNWGNARFQPAEEITRVKPARDWGE